LGKVFNNKSDNYYISKFIDIFGSGKSKSYPFIVNDFYYGNYYSWILISLGSNGLNPIFYMCINSSKSPISIQMLSKTSDL